MPVVPPVRPLLVVVHPPFSGDDPGHEDRFGATHVTRTCRRCRRTFARHPSVSSEGSPTHWLCPACDPSTAGRGSRARLRLVGGADGPDPGHVPDARTSVL